MGKRLIIAEKASVAREIAKVLSVTEKGEGCLLGEAYVISWAVGHLVTLAEPEAYDAKYKKWTLTDLPILPEKMQLKAISKTRTQLKILHQWMHSSEIDSIICATDSGREGELIFRYIYEITKCKKPFQRLWISSMTEEAIREGFANLKDGREYDALYRSAKCRSEADWLVGMNASRAYTVRYHTLLSIGRVQTPTLALLVQRQKEIDAFVSEPYFEVEADFCGYSGIWIDDKEQSRIAKEETAKEIAKKVQGKQAKILSVETEEKKLPPPLLYDLTELQRECNRRYGFSAKKTLDIAQALYEKRKMITYPRTDSRYLSTDMQKKVTATIKRLAETEPYQAFAQPLTEGISFPKRVFDNTKITDHHAILPTETRLRTERLTEEERNVFSLIAARFLSVFYPPYRYEVTKVLALAEGERFLSKGTVVSEQGWQAVEKALLPAAAAKKKQTKENTQQLPPLRKDEERLLQKAIVRHKKTEPPKPYTESTLLSAMEHAGRFVAEETLREQMKDSGLGTPATRAAIIERLLEVGYLTRKGKTLLPTEKGKKLIAVVPEPLRSPETTGKWEKGLSSIAKGTMREERFLESISRYVQFLVAEAQKEQETEVVFPTEERRGKRRKKKTFGKCPLCGKEILENTKSFYCAGWKENCKFTIWKNSLQPYGLELDGKTVQTLLKQGKTKRLPMVLPQTGERGTAVLLLNKEKGGQLEWMDFMRKE